MLRNDAFNSHKGIYIRLPVYFTILGVLASVTYAIIRLRLVKAKILWA